MKHLFITLKLPMNTIIQELHYCHFRIADNEDYPLWFEFKWKKYFLKIYTDKMN